MAIINPKTVIEAEPVNVGDLLTKNYYSIPDYQREFVWQTDHVKQLWRDVIEHYRNNTTNDELVTSPHGYFLGAIVVLERAPGQVEVIDGQQRLTTLTCISSVLYDALDAWNAPSLAGPKSQVERMIGKFESGKWRTNIKLPDQALNDFLTLSCLEHRSKAARTNYWCNDPSAQQLLTVRRSPSARIKGAITESETMVEAFLGEVPDAASRRKRLGSLVTLIAECVVVLKIEATSADTVYAVFDALNNRGVPLSQADLVKNEVIKVAADQAERDEVIDAWSEVRASVETHGVIDLPTFLHYSYLSRASHTQASKLFNAAKQMIANGARRYVTGLKEDAEALEQMARGDTQLWDGDTNRALKDLREVLNTKFSYVALLALHKRYASSQAEFRKAVQMICNFSFRYIKVLEGDAGQLGMIMATVAEKVRDSEPLPEIAKYLLSHATDSDFKREFASASFKNTKLAYYTVYYLEKSMMSGTIPVDHGKEQNLEHIMPKSPGAAWPQVALSKQSNSAIFKHYLWRIGNLLPLPEKINKSLKNKGIDHKIRNTSGKDYESTSLATPKRVKDFLNPQGEWDYTSIEERQQHLADHHAVNAWPLL